MIDLGTYYYYDEESRTLYRHHDLDPEPVAMAGQRALQELWMGVMVAMEQFLLPDSWGKEYWSTNRIDQCDHIREHHLTIARIEHLLITKGLDFYE